MPLAFLRAVAIDLETTSLDVREARIVQFGAAHLNNNNIDLKTAIEEVVNPGIAISEQSSEIHGINNELARQAHDLPRLWPELEAFLKDRVLIGHTVAYDLTVLENRARQHNLEWKKPRSLCVRLLAALALPELHDPSLDRLAAWFDVEIEHRHTALSDAVTAGQIFLKLVPLLAKRGIRTLAEAERFTLQQESSLQRGMEAGWVFPVVDPSEASHSERDRKYDTYAYRHTIGDIMKKTPIVVPRDTKLQNAIEVMNAHEISSVLVASPAKPGLPIVKYAILTERDALRQITKSGAKALSHTVGIMAHHPLKFIREGAFIYRAISRMKRLNIRHLAVVSETQNLLGMVSARDLLRLRTDAAISLDDEIHEAESAAEMAAAWGMLPAVVNSLIGERLDAHTTTRIISEEIRSMTERAVVIAETKMAEDGLGTPPCAYAVVVLGSGGRGESLLKPDQDNAIIFQKGDPGGSEDTWFQELGTRFAVLLDGAGIPFCDGGVMARNARWRGSVATWQDRLEEWTLRPKPQDLLNVDIFLDQVPVYGERTLSLNLFQETYERGSKSIEFAKAMGAKIQRLSNPFGLFGKLKSQGDQLDLKLHGLFPLVTAARTLAIRHNIAARTTKARLQGLIERGAGDTSLMERLIRDHEFILSLMLTSQERQVSSGRKPTNLIDLRGLSREQVKRLKEALSDIQYAPDLVQDLLF